MFFPMCIGHQSPRSTAPNHTFAPSLITTSPIIIAVGAMTYSPFLNAEYSSRGPTKEGIVKPDVTFFGHRMLTASCKSDTAFEIKTGTSFAAPACAGAFNLGVELLERQLGYVPPLYGEEIIRLGQEQLMKYVVKPQGVLIPAGQKDNDYGYGIPAGALIVGAVMPPINLEPVVGIMGIAMLGMMALIRE